MADKYSDVEKPELDERELDASEQAGWALAQDPRITAFTLKEQNNTTKTTQFLCFRV